MIKTITIKDVIYEIHLNENKQVSLGNAEVILIVSGNRRLVYEHDSVSEAELTMNTIYNTLAFVRDMQK